MRLDTVYNQNEMPESTYDLIPIGEYTVMITDAEIKPTQKGDGERLVLTYEILDPQCAGRKYFDGLNFRNPNQIAEQIAKKTLGSIMRATGIARLTDTDQLLNKKMKIRMRIKEEHTDKNGKFQEAQNSIKSYETSTAMPAALPPRPVAPASMRPPVTGGMPRFNKAPEPEAVPFPTDADLPI